MDLNKLNIVLSGTQNGINALFIGNNKKELSDMLNAFQEENKTTSAPASLAQVQEWTKNIKAILKGNSKIQLPLDPIGSPFQKEVWSELQKIPSGSTVSYSELATRLKKPNATRAVASACAKNNIAILIPCHRVLQKNGKLGGYRWGINTKKELLALEKY